MWKREKYVRVRLADLTFIEKTNHFPEDVLPSLQTHFWKFYCFWASAYDGAGEGPFSPCIIYPLHRMEPLEGQSHLELQPVWPEVSLKCFGRRREFHSTCRNPIFPLMWTVYPCPLPPQVSLKPTLLTQALWPLLFLTRTSMLESMQAMHLIMSCRLQRKVYIVIFPRNSA